MKLKVISELTLALVIVVGTSACATKGYVRNHVKESTDQLSARVDTNIGRVESNVAELSDQVGETTRITKDNTNQIKDTSTQLQSAKNDIRAVDDKAGGALNAATDAKTAVAQTGTRVDGLESQFANRNNYTVAVEDSVRFATNSAKLQPGSLGTLDNIAQKMKQDPNSVVVLEGRTDSTGDADYNIKLGQQRLDAVLRYLVVQSGIPIQRVFQISMGKEKPVADNTTKEGREQNRATVIRVLAPAGSPAQQAAN